MEPKTQSFQKAFVKSICWACSSGSTHEWLAEMLMSHKPAGGQQQGHALHVYRPRLLDVCMGAKEICNFPAATIKQIIVQNMLEPHKAVAEVSKIGNL